MNKELTTRELIDACRPDHDDPQRPELAAELGQLARELETKPAVAAAYDCSQHFDRQVRSALDDVPLPADLADRLLHGCEAALVTPASKMTAATPAQTSRRMILADSLSVCLLAIVGGVIGFFIAKNPRPATAEQLAQFSLDAFNKTGPAAKWQAVTANTLAAFPLDAAIAAPARRSVQLTPTAVAYDLTRSGRERALLIVQRANAQNPNLRTFPYTRLNSSGGVTIGAWQRNTRYIYILVVVEDQQRIEHFLRRIPQA